MDKNLLYRSIPKVDVLLEDEKIKQMIGVYGRDIVIDAIRVEMNRLREFIAKCDSEEEAREQVQIRQSRSGCRQRKSLIQI